MSLGTMTSNSESAGQGPVFHDDVSVVGDGSYPTGGSAGVTAKLKALRGDSRAPISGQCYAAGGYVVEFDAKNDKLVVYEQDGGGALAEVANATDLSAVTFKMTITSK